MFWFMEDVKEAAMKTIRKINEELAIAGQITPEELNQIAQQGFKSVLNLRSPEEQGFVNDEQQQVELLGLQYVHIPLDLKEIDDIFISWVIQEVNSMAKPALLHCDTAVRAAAIAVMQIAVRQGASLEQAFQRTQQLGLFHNVELWRPHSLITQLQQNNALE
jgi:uncharacterized protein (TIGR01244 family)